MRSHSADVILNALTWEASKGFQAFKSHDFPLEVFVRHSRSFPVFFVTLLLVSGWFSSVNATVVIRVGLEEMTHASDVVFHGQVERVDVLAPSDGPVTTRMTLRAHEILKGPEHFKDGKLQLHLLGGKGPKYEIRIPGMPRFRAGENVVLFLEKTRDDFALTGLLQGVFRVEEQDGMKTVSRSLSGISLVAYDHDGKMSFVDGASELKAFPLETLLDELRFYIKQASEQKGGAK